MKLDRNNLLKNEKHSSDYSQLYDRVLALASKVEPIMDDIVKVLIVEACECV